LKKNGHPAENRHEKLTEGRVPRVQKLGGHVSRPPVIAPVTEGQSACEKSATIIHTFCFRHQIPEPPETKTVV